MRQIDISFIIPIYNCSKYIQECVKSIYKCSKYSIECILYVIVVINELLRSINGGII